MKDVGLRIRVQRELREAFLEACRAQDKPAAQVLREFMREYVNVNAIADESDRKPSQEVSVGKKINVRRALKPR